MKASEAKPQTGTQGGLSSQRGQALVLTLLAIGVFSTLAATIALSTSFGRLVETNYEDAVNLANASDSALELAARELAAIADWNEVLSGVRTSTLVDGVPGRRVLADGAAIDLPALTNDAHVRAIRLVHRRAGSGNDRRAAVGVEQPALAALPPSPVTSGARDAPSCASPLPGGVDWR